MNYILSVPGLFLLLLSLRYWSRAGDLYLRIVPLGSTSPNDDSADSDEMKILKKKYYFTAGWAMLLTMASGIYFAMLLFGQGQ